MKIPMFIVRLSVKLICCFSGLVHGAWVQTNGPWGGGDVSLLLVIKDQCYANVNNELYVSTDGGLTWKRYNYGLPDSANVNCLAANETYPFAGTRFSGVWRRPFSEISQATGLSRVPEHVCSNRDAFSCRISQSTLTLDCVMTDPTRTTVNLYDISGRIVFSTRFSWPQQECTA